MKNQPNKEYKLLSEKDAKSVEQTINVLRIIILVIIAIIIALVVVLIVVARSDFSSGSSNPTEKEKNPEKPKEEKTEDEEEKKKEDEPKEEEEKETPPPSGPSTTIFNNGYKVIAYYPNRKGDLTSKIQFNKITHLLYAYGYPSPSGDGKMEEIAKFNWVVSQMIKACNNNNVVPILSVGGYYYSSTTTLVSQFFLANTNTDAKIQSLAEDIVTQAKDYGFQGIDIDWEFPNSSTQSQFGKLITALRTLCNKNSMTLSAVVPVDSTTEFTSDVLSKLDFISVMAFSRENEKNLSYDYFTKGVTTWKNKVTKEKILVGVPFNGIPGTISFGDIVSENSNCSDSDSCQVSGKTVYYNGISTIKKKGEYAGKNAGGIMIWEITQDSDVSGKKLLDTIYDITVSTVGLAEK